MGEVMVDAYRLESKLARNARVVVSLRMSDNDRLFTRYRMVSVVSIYIGEMMLLAEDRHGDTRPWVRVRVAEMEAAINGLTGRGQLNEAAKWVYFRASTAMEAWPA